MLRFLAVFACCLLLLFVELLPPVQVHVIEPFTTAIAQVSVWLMRSISPWMAVASAASHLSSTTSALTSASVSLGYWA